MRKILLRSLGLLGSFLFISLFLFTFLKPQWIESSARPFVERQLNIAVENKIDAIQLPESKLKSFLDSKVKILSAQTENKLEEVKHKLKNSSKNILSEQVAKMLDMDCECRKKWRKRLRESMQLELASLEETKAKLINFGQAKYMEIVEKLILDIRVFLGVNSVVFIFLFVISFFKPKVIEHLFLPGGLLLISTLVCSYFYLFKQNWFYTIIYSDYIGFGYLAYLSIVFLFLCDITFNKARVTTEILNAICNALGKAASFSPC
ncbi:hypothetical protein [Aliikangiella sp. IMCC44359]|uniref:hypothetical protein n=1 Tax=Aliikangiella sp. IMCC44359 TaxID=3459125 RepID=UPI00403AA6F5